MYSLPFMNTVCTEHSDTSHSHKGEDENSLTSSKYNTETLNGMNEQIPFNSILCSIRWKSREKQISVRQHAKLMALVGSRLNKPLSERVIKGRCQDIAHARACRHFYDIWATADDQKFLSRFFRKQFLIKVPKRLSVNENLQCERNSVKNSFSTINPSFTLKNRFA